MKRDSESNFDVSPKQGILSIVLQILIVLLSVAALVVAVLQCLSSQQIPDRVNMQQIKAEAKYRAAQSLK